MAKPELSIIGTGNVAFHLGKAWKASGIRIREVYGRSREKAEALAEQLDAEVMPSLESAASVDALILCLTDTAIEEVSRQLPGDMLQAHTSGSVGLEALASRNRGVFYPLQTFSRARSVDMSAVPVCLECAIASDREVLTDLAAALGGPLHWLDSAQRQALHVGAVFASNFPNILYQVGHEVLAKAGMPSDLLNALMLETTRKALDMPPLQAQTGPARRGDMEVMNSHLNYLSDDPELRELYARLSELIIHRTHGKEL